MKNRERLFKGLLLLLAIAVVAGTAILIQSFWLGGDEENVIVGGVFFGECSDRGWNQSHYEGLNKACENLSCTLLVKENVPEEEASVRTAVKELVESGCSAVFLTSYGYGNYLEKVAEIYPDKAFFSISGKGDAGNAVTYFARMYQVRYLSGIVAGAASKTGILGYVTAMPLSETNRAVNAYALGARRANPDARVLVRFTGSWDDEEEEKKAVRLMASEGADVITYHEDKPYALEVAEELGLYSTGYDCVYQDYSEKFLTAALFKWDVIYKRLLEEFISGSTNFSNNYWLGLPDQAVELYPYSELVDPVTRELVNAEKARIQDFRDVFSGMIYDNNGQLRCERDEIISDDELFNGMEWFVEGVEVYE